MRTLVLDFIHGGDILVERLLQEGHDVTSVDVYRVGSESRKEELRSLGAWVGEEVPPGHYDLLVSPAHCPDSFLNGASYSDRRTFHQMVGEFMPSAGPHRIELTGTKAKTSSAHLLAHLLGNDGRRVLLHSSRGQYLVHGNEWEELDRKVSINPVSLLTLPDVAADHVIAEVSLGGSGVADLTLMTNLAVDYPIAAGTRRARDAKASLFSARGPNLVREEEMEIWSAYGRPLQGYGPFLDMRSGGELHDPREAVLNYDGEREITLAGGYLHPSYAGAFDSALAICRELGMDAESVISGLENFKGVPGRGEVHCNGEGTLVVDRNPGVSADSVLHRLETLEAMGAPTPSRLLVSPVDKRVCETLDREAVRSMADARGIPMLWEEGGTFDVPATGLELLFVKEGYL